MAITYLEDCKVFWMNTKNTSYAVGIVDEENFLGHIYYGEKVRNADVSSLLRIHEGPFVPSQNNRDRVSFYDQFPMEYPGGGLGDYRESAIDVETVSGNRGVLITYDSHEILDEKPVLEGLPATFGNDGKR